MNQAELTRGMKKVKSSELAGMLDRRELNFGRLCSCQADPKGQIRMNDNITGEFKFGIQQFSWITDKGNVVVHRFDPDIIYFYEKEDLITLLFKVPEDSELALVVIGGRRIKDDN